MEIKILIEYVEGKLNEGERKEVEKFIVANPDYFEIIGSLNRIKMSISNEDDLNHILSKKADEIWNKIKPQI